MAILEVLHYPDPRLRNKARPVERVDDTVRRLVDDMFDTMYEAEGIGLAAPQVGISQRVMIVDVPDEDGVHQVHALVNPVIVESGSETDKATEGCLSIPGIEEDVTRPVRVVVEGLSPAAESLRIEAEGLLARALQHEIDHLDGILFIDRLSPLKRGILMRKWRKKRRG